MAAAAWPRTTLALVLLALTLVLLVGLPRPLSPDVSGQLWIAGRLRQGARLYLDISEINPPLWFWLAMPVDALAEWLGVAAESVLIAVTGGAALLSLLATDRLGDRHRPGMRAAVLVYGACILLVMPLRDLGQREQIAMMGTLPYAALIAARYERRPGEQGVPGWLAVLVAAGAAVGFAFKHYFVGVPLLLELWLIAALRRDWRPWRPELLVLAAGAVGYLAAILILTPGYLAVSVPELALAYRATGGPDLLSAIRPAQPIWVLIGCAIFLERGAHRLPAITTALLVAGVGFGLAWAIQHKGWPYQSITTTGLLAMALATLLARRSARPRLIAVVALIAPVVLCVVPTQWVVAPDTDIAPALADLRPGDTVAIVAKEGRTVWPSTVNRGFRWSGRRGSFWILAAVDADAHEAGRRDPKIAALGRRMIREAVVDYRCLPPRRIVFVPGRARVRTSASADPLRYFLREPGFVRLLAHYRRLDRAGGFDAFELVRPLPPLPAGLAARLCPRGA